MTIQKITDRFKRCRTPYLSNEVRDYEFDRAMFEHRMREQNRIILKEGNPMKTKKAPAVPFTDEDLEYIRMYIRGEVTLADLSATVNRDKKVLYCKIYNIRKQMGLVRTVNKNGSPKDSSSVHPKMKESKAMPIEPQSNPDVTMISNLVAVDPSKITVFKDNKPVYASESIEACEAYVQGLLTTHFNSHIVIARIYATL